MRLVCVLVTQGMRGARRNGYGLSHAHALLVTADAAVQDARENLDAFFLLGVKVSVAYKPAGRDEEVEPQKLATCLLRRLADNRALAVSRALSTSPRRATACFSLCSISPAQVYIPRMYEYTSPPPSRSRRILARALCLEDGGSPGICGFTLRACHRGREVAES